MLKTKGNRVTYFGHSTFSLTTPSGQVALIDPWVMTNPFWQGRVAEDRRV
jgi:L-ascorbate metabolism protein UlaG (beta-lactamase superfamily)